MSSCRALRGREEKHLGATILRRRGGEGISGSCKDGSKNKKGKLNPIIFRCRNQRKKKEIMDSHILTLPYELAQKKKKERGGKKRVRGFACFDMFLKRGGRNPVPHIIFRNQGRREKERK